MKTTYLGDGAYAEDDGFQVRIFTDRGSQGVHEVYLGWSEFQVLFRYLEESRGVKITVRDREVRRGGSDE